MLYLVVTTHTCLRARQRLRRPARPLERTYLGRRFKNDTERLEALFALYTEMTAKQGTATKPVSCRKN